MRKARSKSISSIKWVERQVQSFTQTQGWWAQPDVMFVTLKASLKHVLEAPVMQVRLKIQKIQTPLILLNREQGLVCQAWQNKANNDTWVVSALQNWCLDYKKQILSSLFYVSRCLRRSSPCHSFSNPSFLIFCSSVYNRSFAQDMCVDNYTPPPHLSPSSSVGWLCLVQLSGSQLKGAPRLCFAPCLCFWSLCDLLCFGFFRPEKSAKGEFKPRRKDKTGGVITAVTQKHGCKHR